MNKANLQTIRESFGRDAYSHKTHEKAAEIEEGKSRKVKWANIVLTILTSGTLISTIITNQMVLLYVTAVLSALMLGFTIFQFIFLDSFLRLTFDSWYKDNFIFFRSLS